MSKMKISEYFNPDQHLTLHQDKEGNMIGGGYQVNNLLYQRKMPLFVSLGNSGGQGVMSGGAGAGVGAGAGSDDCENRHFIPEKFSDLFRDLAVPAGLFMMPALFRPRNYAFEVPEAATESEQTKTTEKNETNTDSDESETDSESDTECRKPVPKDIFDRLLELVTPSERVQHDVKTRKHRRSIERRKNVKQHKNTTKRARSYME